VKTQAFNVVVPEERQRAASEEVEKGQSEPSVGEEDEGVESESPPVVKVPVPTVEVAVAVPAPQNILNGPWSFSSKRGPEAWGLGAELRSLLTGLAESSAERERSVLVLSQKIINISGPIHSTCPIQVFVLVGCVQSVHTGHAHPTYQAVLQLPPRPCGAHVRQVTRTQQLSATSLHSILRG
jgi:hypothetical protein